METEKKSKRQNKVNIQIIIFLKIKFTCLIDDQLYDASEHYVEM